MITTVLFDMGGTLEDIWVDEESRKEAIGKLDAMLRGWGMETGMTAEELRRSVDEGWKRYDAVRSAGDVELKPTQIWGDYILTDFDFPREELQKLLSLDNPGKPHIGNLMVKYGYAETKEKAIDFGAEKLTPLNIEFRAYSRK